MGDFCFIVLSYREKMSIFHMVEQANVDNIDLQKFLNAAISCSSCAMLALMASVLLAMVSLFCCVETVKASSCSLELFAAGGE